MRSGSHRAWEQAYDLLRRRLLSASRVTLGIMEVTENDIERIPVRNLNVPRDEFVAVWVAAERLSIEQAGLGVTDWYAGGVVATCRWMARAVVRPASGPWRLARSPVTRRTIAASEELIEAEFQAAQALDSRRPELAESRPGWCEAIRATLAWAWRSSRQAPITLPAPSAS